MLLCGVLLFYLFLGVLSSFIWLVEVEGTQKVPQAKILQAAAAAGLRPGSFKSSFSKEEVARQILESTSGLSFVEVEVRGTKATIRVVESILPGKTGQPCDLVARRSGIIKELLVLSGTPKVREGDLVQKGQVLISGVVEGEPSEEEKDPALLEEPRYVEAQGIVRARVWYRARGEAAKREVITKKTGRSTRIYCIRWQQKEIIIKGPCQIPYPSYDLKVRRRHFPEWRNITLPVEFVTIEAEEIRKEQIQRSFDEALELATKRAQKNLEKLIPAEASVVRQQMRFLGSSGENLVRVVLTAELIEDIGEKKPLELPR
jgi:similar to stage IV sporulation protein